MTHPVLLERDGHLALVTLNRPEAMNALSLGTLELLLETVHSLAATPGVRAIVFTGAGGKAFCAGADLKERRGMDDNQVRHFVRTIRDTFSAIETLPQPTIAAINGFAFGGGAELTLACDLRVAADTATWGLTEVALGIMPGAGGTQRLPRLIGKGRAKELIFTARRIDAPTASGLGLFNQVVPSSELMAAARALAAEILKNAPIAVAQAKRAINAGFDVDQATGMQIETLAYEGTIHTKDRAEALAAFAEKRPPVFKGE